MKVKFYKKNDVSGFWVVCLNHGLEGWNGLH